MAAHSGYSCPVATQCWREFYERGCAHSPTPPLSQRQWCGYPLGSEGACPRRERLMNLPDGQQMKRECPHCKDAGRGSVFLVVRTNRQNRSQFLGCPNWPRCRYTEPIPESVKMRLMGQPMLFGDEND